MLRAIVWLFWSLVVLALVVLGLANRELVELRLLPEGLADLVGMSAPLELPLFLVIALAVVLGMVVGLVWEWLRHHSIRAELHKRRRGRGPDVQAEQQGRDVLALLDGAKGG